MDPKPSQTVADEATPKAGSTDLAVYRVVAETSVWRIEYQGVRCGRFSTLEEALSTALRLARECAALGRPACVRHERDDGDELGGAFQEWLQARRPFPGQPTARPVGRPLGRPWGWA